MTHSSSRKLEWDVFGSHIFGFRFLAKSESKDMQKEMQTLGSDMLPFIKPTVKLQEVRSFSESFQSHVPLIRLRES